MNLKHLFFLFLFSTFAVGLQAQVKFDAKVSKKKLGINERLRVDFEMNADGDDFNPPRFENFRVVGGPNQAISNSYINGIRSYSKTYSYFLSPTRQGKIRIGQASIIVNGKRYKSIPLDVQVTAAVKNPTEGINPDIVAEDNVHLIAEISDPNPFLNERITVTYKLYVSKEVNITSQWRQLDTPRYADFWSKSIDAVRLDKVYEGKYNGEDYRYVILRTTVLYPQKTGALDIEPLTLDVPIDVPGTKRNLFGRVLTTRVNKTISAGKRTITVKPLPLEGQPANFGGAVGEFRFNIQSDKMVLDANEALTLTTTVSGNGNLMTLSLPEVKVPNSLEIYEPERIENIRTQASGISGSISESYTIVPQYKGTYPIRPIVFSYFDPKTETYKSVTSNELVIEVPNGPVTTEPVVASTTNNGLFSEEIILKEENFKYIKLEANLASIQQPIFFQSTLFWSLVGGPLLLIPLFIVGGRKRKARLADVKGNRLRKANRMARKYLYEAKKNKGDKIVFYEALERALHNYLKAKLSIETGEMEKEYIEQLLIKRQVSEEVVADFKGLLKSCEFARYTPASNVTIQQDYEKAANTISTIDKQIQ
ncbi:BatD family protein [Patiriisocius sp. Uisw_017]|jgi:hypothetical protein|uniref:BatD family protein n=1 Tax=Patiriisocius sp. Uisw_017 TaxID=3230968 RepID=UPI0039E78B5C